MTTEAEAAEMACLLDAMAKTDKIVHLTWSPISGGWRCTWGGLFGKITARGQTQYEAVRQCWERGQGS